VVFSDPMVDVAVLMFLRSRCDQIRFLIVSLSAWLVAACGQSNPYHLTKDSRVGAVFWIVKLRLLPGVFRVSPVDRHIYWPRSVEPHETAGWIPNTETPSLTGRINTRYSERPMCPLPLRVAGVAPSFVLETISMMISPDVTGIDGIERSFQSWIVSRTHHDARRRNRHRSGSSNGVRCTC